MYLLKSAFGKSKIVKFMIFVPLIFSNSESRCDLTKFQLQFMIEKPLIDLLTLSMTVYDVSVLCNRFLNAQKAQIWAGGKAGVKQLINAHSLSFPSDICKYPASQSISIFSMISLIGWSTLLVVIFHLTQRFFL